MAFFARRGKALGISHGPRQYDLPLGHDAGTGFLVLLVALMTFLGVLSLGASFVLSAAGARWTSGLEGRLTVEIPAQSESGTIVPPEDVQRMANDSAAIIARHPGVSQVSVMTIDEVQELVRPWIGDSMLLGKVPLPGLVSVSLDNADPRTADILQSKIRTVAPGARIDTHAEWLGDVLRLTAALQFAAALLVGIIGVAIAAAVAGGVRSRMAVHRAEIELLHVMGAHDSYIARQFQRHSLILAAKGAFCGAACGGLMLAAMGWIAGEARISMLPDFSLSLFHIAALALLPVPVALLAMFTARATVLKALGRMP